MKWSYVFGASIKRYWLWYYYRCWAKRWKSIIFGVISIKILQYIRITNSDDKFDSNGCNSCRKIGMVINFEQLLVEHLQVSLILAYQNEICKLFIKNNGKFMRTKYDELFWEKSIEEKKINRCSNSIHMINHTYRNYQHF